MDDTLRSFLDGDIPAIMLRSLLEADEEYQKESAMLASNARFILRMNSNNETTTEVGKAVKNILDALTKGIPSLGGEPLPYFPNFGD